MKRYQIGEENIKKLERNLEIVESQKNALHKFVVVSIETELPSSSNAGNSEYNPTFEVSYETCKSETRPIGEEQDKEKEKEENNKSRIKRLKVLLKMVIAKTQKIGVVH